MSTEVITRPDTPVKRTSLVMRFAERYGVEPNRMLETLKQTCFRTPPDRPITNEQMAALLLVCEVNDLNPFVRMVHALVDKAGGVVPYIGYDGWVSLVNRQPQMSGVTSWFNADYSECTTRMWRKDWTHPVETTAWLAEVKRGSTPWSTQPKNMLEIRSYVKCARRTFGFPGLHDEYTAREIAAGDIERPIDQPVERIKNVLERTPIPPIDDGLAPDDYPPRTLASWMAECLDADDQETSALVVEEAKPLLPPEQHAELATAYRAKWTPKEST